MTKNEFKEIISNVLEEKKPKLESSYHHDVVELIFKRIDEEYGYDHLDAEKDKDVLLDEITMEIDAFLEALK